jgi:hypothetical protein
LNRDKIEESIVYAERFIELARIALDDREAVASSGDYLIGKSVKEARRAAYLLGRKLTQMQHA